MNKNCPICLDHLQSPFSSSICGHTFCYNCIIEYLRKGKASCPVCQIGITEEKLSMKTAMKHSGTALNIDEMDEKDIEQALTKLQSRKRALALESKDDSLKSLLFHQFLLKTRDAKLLQMKELQQQLDYLNQDLEKYIPCHLVAEDLSGTVPDSSLSSSRKKIHTLDPLYSKTTLSNELELVVDEQFDRLTPHMNDMIENYFQSKVFDGKDDFPSILLQSSKYSRFKTLASIHFADHFLNLASSIVSSIEFDKDDEFFATAGVTKKIKLFKFDAIVGDHSEVTENAESSFPRYPEKEMSCGSKISCLSWNGYVKSSLVSSDYEGIVTLWDSSTGQVVSKYEEHEKRVWSVDWSDLTPSRFISGGDDCKVKLWSSADRFSVGRIESKANVCSVKFHPKLPLLVYGSADHNIYLYDMRKLSEPLHVFKGHKKAVSYVKFLSPSILVSASTDSTLKSWDLAGDYECVKSFSGHTNEKNFVGLSVNSNGTFLSCGSESNEVFAFQASLSCPIASHRFGNNLDSVTGVEAAEEDPALFVSSVCWMRKNPEKLVCANSSGRVKVMQLVS